MLLIGLISQPNTDIHTYIHNIVGAFKSGLSVKPFSH